MIISYTNFSNFRVENIDKALGREAKLLMFFLFTTHDSRALERLKEISADLHALTGSQCAGILFAPPDPSRRLKADDLGKYANPDEEPELWKKINLEMTNNTYEIAKKYKIPFEQLPAVLFVSRDTDEYAHLSLRRKSFADLHTSLREILSHWYNQNEDTFKNNGHIWRDYITEKIIPLLVSEKALAEKDRKDKIVNIIKHAKRAADHPGEFNLFVRALEKNSLVLRNGDEELNYGNIKNHIDEVVKSRTTRVFFPLHEITQIDRNIQIHSGYQVLKQLRDEVAEWASKLMPFSKYVSGE